MDEIVALIMCTVAATCIAFLLYSIEVLWPFFKVNLLLVKVGIVRALEIRTLWLHASRGKYEAISWSSFVCQYSCIPF